MILATFNIKYSSLSLFIHLFFLHCFFDQVQAQRYDLKNIYLYSYMINVIRYLNMLSINSMQVLFRQSTLMQSLMTHTVKVQLIINGSKQYSSKQVPIRQKLAVWNADQCFPNIQVPPLTNNFLIQFYFIRNNKQVGKTKCNISLGMRRKDCLDIADRNFQIIGKFVYTAFWKNNQVSDKVMPLNNKIYQPQRANDWRPSMGVKQQAKFYMNQNYYAQKEIKTTKYPQMGNQVKVQQKASISQYRPPDLSKPYFKNSSYSELKIQKKKNSNESIFTSWLASGGCFGKRKLKKSYAYFAIQPIVINQRDLQYAPVNISQAFPIQYYSKSLN